jgi:hypothetical protein
LSERTPDVLAFRLSLVTTAVFDGTLLAFKLAGMLTFVSTAPFLFVVPVFEFAALFVFPFELFVPGSGHPVRRPARAKVASIAEIRRIAFLLCFHNHLDYWNDASRCPVPVIQLYRQQR